ncbi:hypothetical protein HG536_0A04300 [Torulaspora globosa]|uniref:Uncharacterized protein n=1 Tax=Torulaspora globosa TaxID=48254 RepID=A0A7G3ZAS6_9SACH|nr:uncharacterized protein HG536_0A04300 [Torulaspora globosa]QLL30612.1 hypothetical protein HG536_0A04300 [Torulaspora globosa]
MKIDEQISQLLLQEECGSRRKLTLILVVGDGPRNHIEHGLSSESGKLSSVAAVAASRADVDVLFLSKLQYLFMYLMKFEAEEALTAIRYNYFVIYGLDQGILSAATTGEQSLGDRLRVANLICNAAFRIKRKHGLLDVRLIPWDDQSDTAERLARIERYWRHIC